MVLCSLLQTHTKHQKWGLWFGGTRTMYVSGTEVGDLDWELTYCRTCYSDSLNTGPFVS